VELESLVKELISNSMYCYLIKTLFWSLLNPESSVGHALAWVQHGLTNTNQPQS